MFTLAHSGDRSCGIPDGETFVIVGGGEQIHKFVTRWERFQSYGDNGARDLYLYQEMMSRLPFQSKQK